MRAVISVSLSGRAYQFEDDAHASLAHYLDGAERSLEDNPDRAEILADLERAIADKCERFLNAHKTVVTLPEIEQVIGEMGPVEDGSETAGPEATAHAERNAGQHPGAQSGEPGVAPKRLYLISEGALIGGVCKGIAVYFNIDVALVRVLFVIAAILTGGLVVVAYLAMMFIVPYAHTPEEVAAARGLPFNARVLVEQWKLRAARFADAAAHAARTGGSRAERARWRAEWRQARAQWRREWRQSRAEWRAERRRYWADPRQRPAYPSAPLPPLAAFFASLVWAALGLLAALITLAWLFVLLSLITTGAVFGWSLGHVPLWAAIVALIVIYHVVVSPLRRARRPDLYGYGFPAHALADALTGVVLLVLLVWLLGHPLPAVQHAFNALTRSIAAWWHHPLSGPPASTPGGS